MNFYYLACNLVGWRSCFQTLVHEIFHILMFHSYLYSYYVDEDGTNLGLNSVIRLKPGYIKTYQLILPKLVAFARKYYNCDSLEGLDLENDETSPGSHWEDSIFRDENMSPIDRPNKQISNFTLNFLESTGWYLVDYSKAMPYLFGNERGCGFAQSACKNTILSPEYCSKTYSSGCQEDYSAIGVCYSNYFSGTCKTLDGSYTTLCNEKPNKINCVFCSLVESQGGVVSGDSSCFASNLTDGKLSYNNNQASCYKAQCVMNGGQKHIIVKIGTIEEMCTQDDQIILVAGYTGKLLCPKISEFCKYQEIKCSGDCLEDIGLCLVEKNCIYFEGNGVCAANCVSCKSSTFCLNCKTGYYINYNEGIEDKNFCQICNDICPKCPDGNYYDTINKVCKKCYLSCSKCKGGLATDCLSCKNQLNLLVNNECLDCSEAGSTCLACGKNQLSQIICTKCIQGYYSNQGICIKCVANCLDCITSSCITCAQGFYNQLGLCQSCESNCLTCEQTGKNCKSCRTGQFLSLSGYCLDFDCVSLTNCNKCEGTEILICLECKAGNYLASDKACNKCISNCESCSSSLDCNTCSVGFYLFQNTCLPCGNKCASCKNLSDCTQCMPNYQLDGQKNCNLIECKFNCRFCKGLNTNDCITCNDGFFLEKTGICYKCSNMCLTCKGQGEDQCLSCREGKSLVDGRCFNIVNTDYSNVKSTGGLLNLTSIYVGSQIEEEILVSNNKKIIEKISGFLGILNNKEKEELGETLFKITQVDKLSKYDLTLIGESLRIINNITADFKYLSIENKTAITTLNFFTNTLFNMKRLINENNASSVAKDLESNILETAKLILNPNMKLLTSKNNELSFSNNFYDAKLLLLTNGLGETLKITNTKMESLFDLSFNLYSNIISKNAASQLFLKSLTWKSNPYFLAQDNVKITENVYDFEFFSDPNTNTPLNVDLGKENITLSLERNKSQAIPPNQTYACVFWDTAKKNWSTKNITTVIQGDTIKCMTSHFTSFSFYLTNTTNLKEDGIWNASEKVMIKCLLLIGIAIFL